MKLDQSIMNLVEHMKGPPCHALDSGHHGIFLKNAGSIPIFFCKASMLIPGLHYIFLSLSL